MTPLLTLSLLLLAASAPVKTAPARADRACDGSVEVRSALQDIGAFDDLKLSEKEREARTLEAFAALLDKHRAEPLVWRRYVEEQRRTHRGDADALAAEYAERLKRKPNDRMLAFAHAVALADARPADARDELEKLVRRAPRLVEAHKLLHRLYRGKLKDETRAAAALAKIKSLCPASTRLRDPQDDGEVDAETASRVRAELDADPPPDADQFRWYWNRVLGRKRGAEKAAALEVMKKDLGRLRQGTRPSVLALLHQGYDQLKDREGRRWAEDEIARRFPASSPAAKVTIRRWGVSHPEPLPTDPPESRRAYFAALLEQSAEWVERWPGSSLAWARRVAALRQVKDVPRETLISAARAAVEAQEQHGKTLELRPPLPARMAEALREHGVAAGEVAGLPEDTRPARPKTVAITVDVSEAPDMAPWAAKAKQLSERWYPQIGEILASTGYVPASEIRIEFKKTLRVPALCHGTTVEVSSEWVRKKPDDYGMVIHEITHVAQSLEGPGWMVEGVADYIRWHVFETPQLPKVDPAKNSYDDGYRVTGAFLAWAANTYSKTLVRRLNVAMRGGAYDDELFATYTGKDLPTLWAEFLAAGAPAAMGPDAPLPRS